MMKEQKPESYFGQRIAVDASMSIYRFLIKKGTQMLINEAGGLGMFYQTIRLLEAGIKPVYVFDGPPPDLKKQELAKRFSKREDAFEELAVAIASQNKEDIKKFSKRTMKVTQQHNEGCKKLLRLMGVPVVEAPSGAEARCAALCKAGKVYAVASEDVDSLTFGAPIFLRHLMDPSSGKVPVMGFEISKILEEMNLDMDQFIDLCILSGCDYCESIQGIGGPTALKLICQHGSIEKTIEDINKQKYQIPDNWPYSEARLLFKGPIFSMEEKPEKKWTTPNEEGLISFLVNENGFNIDSDEGMASIFSNVLVSRLLEEVASFPLKERAYIFSMLFYHVYQAIEKIKAAKHESSQGRLESFFKPAKNLSAPAKRKGSKCTLQFPNLAFKPKTVSTQVSVNPQPRFLGSFKMPTMVL
ncbi:hypothetical protein EUGRSUZ_B01834, partial [Eucalyptus grandis]